jgi:hypothetical protein
VIEQYVTVEGYAICVPQALRYDIDDEVGKEMQARFIGSIESQYLMRRLPPAMMSRAHRSCCDFLRKLEHQGRLYCESYDAVQRCFVSLEDQIKGKGVLSRAGHTKIYMTTMLLMQLSADWSLFGRQPHHIGC